MGPETNKIIGDWTEDVEKNLWFRNSPANVTEAHTHRGLKWKVERGSAGHYHQISRWQCLRQHCTACNPCHTITLDIAILRMTFCIICTLLLNSGDDLYGSVLQLRVSGALLGKCSRPPLILSTSQLGPTSSPQLPLCTFSYMQLPKQLRCIQVDRGTCHKGAQTR